ncbi:hypothetical protein DAEQUDRAFT_732227 [Daedalea quercina L-15889]|uniref:Uncharacterized protein n=1 Tax=Daedalea quercina L-15889 TaxID=1314783 RepID=A0A165LRX2_9APHY|nr:hypothetical protein DAEQUDRAFT_732227 [Daedalea quercina L-15889]
MPFQPLPGESSDQRTSVACSSTAQTLFQHATIAWRTMKKYWLHRCTALSVAYSSSWHAGNVPVTNEIECTNVYCNHSSGYLAPLPAIWDYSKHVLRSRDPHPDRSCNVSLPQKSMVGSQWFILRYDSSCCYQAARRRHGITSTLWCSLIVSTAHGFCGMRHLNAYRDGKV